MGKGKAKIKQPLLKNNNSSTANTKQEERRLKSLLKKQAHRSKNYACHEEVAFASQLEQENWSIRYMDGDGNCLFRSVSDQLFGSDSRYADIRAAVVAYMKREAAHFSCFMEDDQPFDEYIAEMAENGTWGGNHELYAVSQIYQSVIHVHQYKSPTFVFEYGNGNSRNIKTLHISYHGEHHYNSLHNTTSGANVNKSSSNQSDSNNGDIKIVAQAVPWCSIDAIEAALAKTTSTANAIELLMTTEHPLSCHSNSVARLEEQASKINIEDSHSTTSYTTDTNQKTLSKKEKRLLKKGKPLRPEKSEKLTSSSRDDLKSGNTINV